MENQIFWTIVIIILLVLGDNIYASWVRYKSDKGYFAESKAYREALQTKLNAQTEQVNKLLNYIINKD